MFTFIQNYLQLAHMQITHRPTSLDYVMAVKQATENCKASLLNPPRVIVMDAWCRNKRKTERISAKKPLGQVLRRRCWLSREKLQHILQTHSPTLHFKCLTLKRKQCYLTQMIKKGERIASFFLVAIRSKRPQFSTHWRNNHDLRMRRRRRNRRRGQRDVLGRWRLRGRAVRALDLQFGGPEFKSRPDRLLDLLMVVPSSNPR